MSLKESIVEDTALERFEAQRCEFKEAANNFSSTLATLRDTRYVPPQRVAQDVTERQQRVLAMLSESGAIGAPGSACEAWRGNHRTTSAQGPGSTANPGFGASDGTRSRLTMELVMRESELSSGLFRANWGLFGPIGAYSLRENADSTPIGGVQPCPRMGDTAHFGSAQSAERSALLQSSSAHLPDAPNIEVEQRDRDACLLSAQLDAPVIDSLERLTPAFPTAPTHAKQAYRSAV